MTALATIPRNTCPDCGQPLDTYQADQPALFTHAGYGATERTTVAHCTCGWSLTRERSEVRPCSPTST
jgi:hypothetical protein